MVACAITDRASVGVDVECLDRDVNADGIATRFFAASETAHLARLDESARHARFFDLWTLKEALVKGWAPDRRLAQSARVHDTTRRRHGPGAA